MVIVSNRYAASFESRAQYINTHGLECMASCELPTTPRRAYLSARCRYASLDHCPPPPPQALPAPLVSRIVLFTFVRNAGSLNIRLRTNTFYSNLSSKVNGIQNVAQWYFIGDSGALVIADSFIRCLSLFFEGKKVLVLQKSALQGTMSHIWKFWSDFYNEKKLHKNAKIFL